jgi:hypothetical protein
MMDSVCLFEVVGVRFLAGCALHEEELAAPMTATQLKVGSGLALMSLAPVWRVEKRVDDEALPMVLAG